MNKTYSQCINFIKEHLEYEYRYMYDSENIMLGYSLYYQPVNKTIFDNLKIDFVLYRQSYKYSWKFLKNDQKVNNLTLKTLRKIK